VANQEETFPQKNPKGTRRIEEGIKLEIESASTTSCWDQIPYKNSHLRLIFHPSSFETLAHRPCRRRTGAHPLELNQLHGEHEELSMHPVDDGPTLEDRRTELPLTL
jgi:hypothetical protein